MRKCYWCGMPATNPASNPDRDIYTVICDRPGCELNAAHFDGVRKVTERVVREK